MEMYARIVTGLLLFVTAWLAAVVYRDTLVIGLMWYVTAVAAAGIAIAALLFVILGDS